MIHRYFLLLLLSLTVATLLQVQAQVNGGNHVYEFLNLPASSRVSALGGQLITVVDDDVNLGFANPAVLNSGMHQQLSFSHQFLSTGIHSGYAAYSHNVDTSGLTWQAGLRYISYGKFELTDETDEVIGDFRAGEYALTLGASKQLYERLSVGTSMRLVSSQFESYNSFGLTFDLGAVYHDTASLFNVALVLRNAGTQISTYNNHREPVPFEMLVGASKQLRYLPFRLSITYRYFDRWNVLYDDPNSEEDPLFAFGGDAPANNSSLDNFARHLVLGGEFLFGKGDNFRLRFGYDHLKRKELSLRNVRSLAGFSFGIGVKVNHFRIDFAQTANHLGAGQTHLSISTNLKEFVKPTAGILN